MTVYLHIPCGRDKIACHGMEILLSVHCSLLLMLLVTGNSMYCTLSGIRTGPLPMKSSTPHPKTTRDDVPGPSGEWSANALFSVHRGVDHSFVN